MRNASCLIDIKPNGIYLILTPAEGGGRELLFNDVDTYLKNSKIYDYDVKKVNDALLALKERTVVFLSSTMIPPIDESVVLFVDPEKMFVRGKFMPPSGNGSLLTYEDIIAAMVAQGVRFGAVEANINEFLAKREYFKDFVLAKAMPATQGTDARVEYYFNTDLTLKPKTNEDGSVDFHQLDNICKVRKGDLLARLIPEVEGKNGIDITGTVIRPNKVARKILKYGKKITITEDKLEIYSDVDGHVALVEDRVFVSDSYEVGTDVGPLTGDIDFDGSVIVKGSVISGYSIRAEGDIIVEGVVEGAVLEAGGQIVLKRGIQGSNKGILKAGNNVVAKFIENATVTCGGYLQTDSILHSKVAAKGDIVVNGRNGFITGGEISSGTMISVKTAGNAMETKTLLQAGISPDVMEEYKALEAEAAALNEEREAAETILINYATKVKKGIKLDTRGILTVRENTKKKSDCDEKLAKITERLNVLSDMLADSHSGSISVSDCIYPGCKLVIATIPYYVKTVTHHSKFIRDKADVRIVAL